MEHDYNKNTRRGYLSLKDDLVKLSSRQNFLKNLSYFNMALSSLNAGLNLYNGNTGSAALWGVSAAGWYLLAKGQLYRKEETEKTIKVFDKLKDLEAKPKPKQEESSLDQRIESQDFPEKKDERITRNDINKLEE
ncbi:hypothetical protein HZA97_07725 [Candidatus Woesearchaeota archaeon]|nr:hypothetical protein [Candidatus Woesearchaeota archaeon]